MTFFLAIENSDDLYFFMLVISIYRTKVGGVMQWSYDPNAGVK